MAGFGSGFSYETPKFKINVIPTKGDSMPTLTGSFSDIFFAPATSGKGLDRTPGGSRTPAGRDERGLWGENVRFWARIRQGSAPNSFQGEWGRK